MTSPGSEAPLSGLTVRITGMSYAPEPTGIGPYTAGLARTLVESGAAVDVVAGMPHYPTWRLRPEDRWRLRREEVLDGVRVHRARHFVPHRQTILGRLAWEGTFLANAGAIALRERPDVVIGVTPSLSGGVIGARTARRHGAPFGVVVQDLVGKAARQSGIAGGGRVASSAGAVERWVLSQAAQVAVVSESFRPQMQEYGLDPGRVRLLRNWTHIGAGSRERASVRGLLGWAEDDFVVLHTGNMGLKQGLHNLLAAARALGPDSGVRVVLMGDGNQRRSLEQAGQDIANLSIVDPVDGDLYPDVLRAADLLVVNELPSVGDMSLPSKLTSYFSAGRPVLAAVSADGACARELASTGGAGVRVEPDRPQELADAVRALREDPVDLKRRGALGADYASRVLGRSAAAHEVRELVRSLITRP